MDLKTWMIKNRWKQPELARETGISRPTISCILKRTTDVTLKTAMTIVKFTNGAVTYEDLARETKKNDESDKNGHHD